MPLTPLPGGANPSVKGRGARRAAVPGRAREGRTWDVRIPRQQPWPFSSVCWEMSCSGRRRLLMGLPKASNGAFHGLAFGMVFKGWNRFERPIFAAGARACRSLTPSLTAPGSRAPPGLQRCGSKASDLPSKAQGRGVQVPEPFATSAGSVLTTGPWGCVPARPGDEARGCSGPVIACGEAANTPLPPLALRTSSVCGGGLLLL